MERKTKSRFDARLRCLAVIGAVLVSVTVAGHFTSGVAIAADPRPCSGDHSLWTGSKSSDTTYSARAWIVTQPGAFCTGTLSSINSLSTWAAVQGSGGTAPGQIVQAGLLQEVENGIGQTTPYYFSEYNDGSVLDQSGYVEFGEAPPAQNHVYSVTYQPHYWCSEDNSGCGALVTYGDTTEQLASPWDPEQQWTSPWTPSWSGETKDNGDNMPGNDPRVGDAPVQFTTQQIDPTWNDWTNYSSPSGFTTYNSYIQYYRIDRVAFGDYDVYTYYTGNLYNQC